MTRSCGERANAGNPFGENGNGEQTEGRMIENPYKRLPPLERKPDGTPYRMTPAQRKQANALIRRESERKRRSAVDS